jgi:hypothetical protein
LVYTGFIEDSNSKKGVGISEEGLFKVWKIEKRDKLVKIREGK